MSTSDIPNNLLERHRRVMAGFVMQGSSLTAWCKAHGIKHQNAHKALLEKWKGPKAAALVKEILCAAGVEK